MHLIILCTYRNLSFLTPVSSVRPLVPLFPLYFPCFFFLSLKFPPSLQPSIFSFVISPDSNFHFRCHPSHFTFKLLLLSFPPSSFSLLHIFLLLILFTLIFTFLVVILHIYSLLLYTSSYSPSFLPCFLISLFSLPYFSYLLFPSSHAFITFCSHFFYLILNFSSSPLS